MAVKQGVRVSLRADSYDSFLFFNANFFYLSIFEKSALKEQVVLVVVKLKTLNKALVFHKVNFNPTHRVCSWNQFSLTQLLTVISQGLGKRRYRLVA